MFIVEVSFGLFIITTKLVAHLVVKTVTVVLVSNHLKTDTLVKGKPFVPKVPVKLQLILHTFLL